MNIATISILTLCAAVFAGPSARAAQEPDPLAVPVVQDPVLHLYRADVLAGLTVKGDGDQEIGALESLVIDTTDGEIAYAVVTEGGMLGLGVHHRLVPWTVLHFRPKGGTKRDKDKPNCEVVALLSGEDIAECPSFKRGAPITADVERKAREAARLPPLANVGECSPARLVSSLDIKGCKVRGQPRTLMGSVESVLVDPLESRVACLVLDTKGVPGLGEKRVVVPWAAAEVVIDDKNKPVFTTLLSKERLETAPIYDTTDWKRMTSPAWLREVALYYEVEPYWIRTPAASEASTIR